MSPSLAHGTSSHYPKGLTNPTPFGRSLCWSANSLLELVGVFMPQMQDKNIVEGAFQWWEDSGNNAKISPRQLESALKIYIQKGDLRDVLPLTCNIDKLISILNLENLMKKDDKEAAREFLKKEFPSIPFIISKSPTLMNYFLPLLTIEKIESYMSIYDDVFNHIVSRSTNDVVYRNICKNVIQRNNFGVLTKKIRRFLIENKEVSLAFSKDDSQ